MRRLTKRLVAWTALPAVRKALHFRGRRPLPATAPDWTACSSSCGTTASAAAAVLVVVAALLALLLLLL